MSERRGADADNKSLHCSAVVDESPKRNKVIERIIHTLPRFKSSRVFFIFIDNVLGN